MSDITILGPPQSSYVWTTRLLCEEKGISYDLEPVSFGSEAHLQMHPFGKVPVLQHGDLRLYETQAITAYLDKAFDGPSFVPDDAIARARMDQWIGAINAYMYDDIIRKYVQQYIFPKGANGEPDRAVIDETLPRIERDIGALETGLQDQAWLAGENVSLADLFLLPIVTYMSNFPEGQEVLGGKPKLQRVVNELQARPSFDRTIPPPQLDHA